MNSFQTQLPLYLILHYARPEERLNEEEDPFDKLLHTGETSTTDLSMETMQLFEDIDSKEEAIKKEGRIRIFVRNLGIEKDKKEDRRLKPWGKYETRAEDLDLETIAKFENKERPTSIQQKWNTYQMPMTMKERKIKYTKHKNLLH